MSGGVESPPAQSVTEREQIVAWLREMSAFRLGLAERAQSSGVEILNDGMGQAYLNAAKAIERGDHLTTKEG